MEQVYKPAWKSFYADFFMMLLVLIAAGVVHYLKCGESWLKWVWIAACVIDLLLLVFVCLKRSISMTLILRDDPNSPANQEIAFETSNPMKPFSSDFRKSVEIGLANVKHIEIKQTMLQTLLNIGDLVITSSGTGDEEIRAKNIPSPAKVRDTIQEHARKYSMGSHPASAD